MNRRHFLSSTAAIATLTQLDLHAADATPPRRIKIGFLGVAHSHALPKLKTAAESPDWELVGVHAENEKLQATCRANGHRLLSPGEVVEAAEVVVVDSIVRDHFRDAKIVLSAGKHVHIEKPPALTVPEFRELQDLARSKNRLMQMGYMWRYNPGINRMIEATRQGWLGDVTLVQGQINSFYAGPARPDLAEFKGGGMFELGCHLIDAVVRMLGRPEKVTPILRRNGPFKDNLNDNAIAIFEYPSVTATITVNLMQPDSGPHRYLEVMGTNGTMTVKPIEPPSLQTDFAKPAGPYQAKIQKVDLPRYQRYAPELADLADAIRNRRPLSVTQETDLIVHETLLRACDMI